MDTREPATPALPAQPDDTGAPDTPAPARRPRRLLVWLIAAVAAIVIAAGAVVHASAHTAYDEAHIALAAAAEDAMRAESQLAESRDATASALTPADLIVEAAADDLVDPTTRADLAHSAEAAGVEVAAADELLATGADTGAAEKPEWTWDLFAAASTLSDRADAATAATATMQRATADLDAAAAAMLTAATALYASTVASADALEQANVSARIQAVFDFRDAAEAVSRQSLLGSGASVAFSTYAQSAAVLKDSAAASLAAKAGPLLTARLEIEDYARSMSGGVLLDFDWESVVAGASGPSRIGGTATWNPARGGFSTITLSHSVAEWWPSADARALVAHEVGHAITSKCHDMFDSENAAANEEWATAWAISMGHTADGNGVQAYGYPSQAMIEAAAMCR